MHETLIINHYPKTHILTIDDLACLKCSNIKTKLVLLDTLTHELVKPHD
jgi:hypothetical protein